MGNMQDMYSQNQPNSPRPPRPYPAPPRPHPEPPPAFDDGRNLPIYPTYSHQVINGVKYKTYLAVHIIITISEAMSFWTLYIFR